MLLLDCNIAIRFAKRGLVDESNFASYNSHTKLHNIMKLLCYHDIVFDIILSLVL